MYYDMFQYLSLIRHYQGINKIYKKVIVTKKAKRKNKNSAFCSLLKSLEHETSRRPWFKLLSLTLLMEITYLLLRIRNILVKGVTHFARSVFRYLLLNDLLKQFKASFFGICLQVLALLTCSILTSSQYS